jgi:regulator of replication initiation timing
MTDFDRAAAARERLERLVHNRDREIDRLKAGWVESLEDVGRLMAENAKLREAVWRLEDLLGNSL